jgi:peptidoglycan-N-acetylglucosamine deacetylase
MNILTFDIEEWFHILDIDSTKTSNEWKHFESRIHANIERIFLILKKTDQRATFFCLGWIAEKYPEIIRQIVKHRCEIGSHTRMHQLVYEQDPDEFRKDVEHSIKTLEDISGKKVKYFRAPGFSIREDNKWAFEIISELGIEADSSIFPGPRAHGGFPSYRSPIPSILQYEGIKLKEFPINFITLWGNPIIFSGGGYFRLFPYPLIKHWTINSSYVMTYLHPRDFDATQPIINDLSMIRKFKSCIGLKNAESKLEKWLSDFEFTDMATAIQMIDWENVPIVEI